MKYRSTRNASITSSPSMSLLNGIASDGGLFMFDAYPKNLPSLAELSQLSILDLYAEILSALIFDISKSDMSGLVRAAYTSKFETEDLTPLVSVGDAYILELFRGPTSAFKDVALSLLPYLIAKCARINQVTDDIMILTATSGDTGKAAMAGFADVSGTRITVFYPENGVSEIQQAQMLTQEGANVSVCAIKGNFDDAQTGVKEIFKKVTEKGLLNGSGIRLSSANSINIGRLAPQTVYYFKAYFDLVHTDAIHMGDKVDFVVPTGNFGDILAGYIAKGMGLPVGALVCASNQNDVLTEFIQTGKYDRKRFFHKTASPSMDILVSSNLERLLYLMSGNDSQTVSQYMLELETIGEYTVSEDIKSKLLQEFSAYSCDDTTTFATIKEVYEKYDYLMDTHTAVAWHAYNEFKRAGKASHKCVVLSTASPYKFSSDVLRSISDLKCENDFEAMAHLHELTKVPIPKNLASLENKPVIHRDSIDKDGMLSYVLKSIKNT